MEIKRRKIIGSAAATVSFFGAGCISGGSDPKDHVSDWHKDPMRATGAEVEINRTKNEDNVEYLPDEEAVRLTSGQTRPVKDWLENECPYIIADYVAGEIPYSDSSISVGVTSTIEENTRVVVVSRELRLAKDGSVISKPSVGFEELRNSVPRSVTANISFKKFTNSCKVSVYIRDTVIRRQ